VVSAPPPAVWPASKRVPSSLPPSPEPNINLLPLLFEASKEAPPCLHPFLRSGAGCKTLLLPLHGVTGLLLVLTLFHLFFSNFFFFCCYRCFGIDETTRTSPTREVPFHVGSPPFFTFSAISPICPSGRRSFLS